MKKSVAIWNVKDRDWQKDIEILKVQAINNNEWMQKMQFSQGEMFRDLKSFKDDINNTCSSAQSESLSLRNQWDRQMESLNLKFSSYDKLLEQHSKELLLQESQRMDDLELLEQAISVVQGQQVRLRSSVDESIAACRTDTVSVSAKIDRIESPLIAVKVEIGDIRKEILQKEQETRHRFDNIAAVLKVFSEALHISPPTFVERTIS